MRDLALTSQVKFPFVCHVFFIKPTYFQIIST